MCLLKKQLRYGIYGGAFDPVHLTHLNVAKSATQFLELDALFWIPTGLAWHKAKSTTKPEHRIQMLKLAFAQCNEEYAQKWQISTCEIDRAGNSYTIDTVEFLQKEFIELDVQWYLVMGVDQFNQLQTWYQWEQLLERVTLAVAHRANFDVKLDPAVKEKAKWLHVPLEASALSSSEVRAVIGRLCKEPCQNSKPLIKQLSAYVPQSVAEYILQQQLYQ